jgi:hypothetical protein
MRALEGGSVRAHRVLAERSAVADRSRRRRRLSCSAAQGGLVETDREQSRRARAAASAVPARLTTGIRARSRTVSARRFVCGSATRTRGPRSISAGIGWQGFDSHGDQCRWRAGEAGEAASWIARAAATCAWRLRELQRGLLVARSVRARALVARCAAGAAPSVVEWRALRPSRTGRAQGRGRRRGHPRKRPREYARCRRGTASTMRGIAQAGRR